VTFKTILCVLVPAAALAGLTACGSDTPVAEPAPAPTTAAPIPPADPSPTVSPSADAACPPDVAALHKAAGLTDDYRINPADVNCVQRWATAKITAVDPAKQGDGRILFEYKSGQWVKIDEGSALECTKYGIPTSLGSQIPCQDD
jgi:hypothetical protein